MMLRNALDGEHAETTLYRQNNETVLGRDSQKIFNSGRLFRVRSRRRSARRHVASRGFGVAASLSLGFFLLYWASLHRRRKNSPQGTYRAMARDVDRQHRHRGAGDHFSHTGSQKKMSSSGSIG